MLPGQKSRAYESVRRSRPASEKARKPLAAGNSTQILRNFYHAGNAILHCRNHSRLHGFLCQQQVSDVMFGKNEKKPGDVKSEFRRQMRSAQLRRFVGTLPTYAVDPELPERFVKLLHQLDRAVEEADAGRPTPAAQPQ
jgi:hypothetical protein